MSGVLDVAKKVFHVVTGRATLLPPMPTRTMHIHTEKVRAVAFFKDGRRVVTASYDNTLRIWDVEKGVLAGGPFEGHTKSVRSVAISPDGRRIASGGLHYTIIFWDVERKQKVYPGRLVKHTSSVHSLCFSPNGKRLASGSGDKIVIIWDAETGAVLSILYDHQHTVLSVTFRLQPRWGVQGYFKLASGSCDSTIRFGAPIMPHFVSRSTLIQLWFFSGTMTIGAIGTTNGGKCMDEFECDSRVCTSSNLTINIGYTDSSYISTAPLPSCFPVSRSHTQRLLLWEPVPRRRVPRMKAIYLVHQFLTTLKCQFESVRHFLSSWRLGCYFVSASDGCY
ncbi:WD40-repeat-containing domain protein [Suillus americanus]|nr:WD40-repeat-containing domain protein [Suillus americanus]